MSNTLDEFIASHGIIAICRRIYGEDLLHLAEALHEGGVRLMEVTFDQTDPQCIEHTTAAVAALCKTFPDMYFGAGTVLNAAQVTAARQAGGRFIISPNTDVDVIHATKEQGLISIPGAMTPSEVMSAHNAGADFVKLFPAGYLGLGYLKDLVAPISHVRLLATGGVTVDNFEAFLRGGCCGAGVAGKLCDRARIKEGDWAGLTDMARQFTATFARVAEEKGWAR